MTYHHELVTNIRYIYKNVLDEKYIKLALQLTDNIVVQVYSYKCVYVYMHIL